MVRSSRRRQEHAARRLSGGGRWGVENGALTGGLGGARCRWTCDWRICRGCSSSGSSSSSAGWTGKKTSEFRPLWSQSKLHIVISIRRNVADYTVVQHPPLPRGNRILLRELVVYCLPYSDSKSVVRTAAYLYVKQQQTRTE